MTILNPISEEQTVLRNTLVPSLLDNLRLNLSRKNANIKLFEIAPVFVPSGAKLPQERWMIAGLMHGLKWGEAWNAPKEWFDFYDVKGDPWEFVHNGYGKGLSFVVLLVLMLLAFWLLPELYLNINGLFELPWRKTPGHDYKKHVGRILGKLARPKAVAKKLEGADPPGNGPRVAGSRKP